MGGRVLTICFHLGTALTLSRIEVPSRERYSFFDTELFKVLGDAEPKNVITSPLSVKLLLAMLIEGADETTAEEIRVALRLPKDKEAMRKEFNTWLTLLQGVDPSSDFRMATQVFLSEEFRLNPRYENTLEKYYRTGVVSVKFRETKEASRIINRWASDRTAGLIQRVVKENAIAPDTKLMLMSAVYFKGVWSTSFSGGERNVRCFYTLDKKCKISPMMSNTGYYNYGYINRLDAQALRIPYKNEKYFMLLLLPNEGNKVEQLSRDLVHVSLNSILSEIKSQEIFVQIPKFEISFETDFVEILKKLQVSSLFSPRANFSNITLSNSDSLTVQNVLHSAKITVNEHGSEAAGSTGAMFVPLMGGAMTSFVANHPFLFFIMDSIVNSIIFAGKLTVPVLPGDHDTMSSHEPMKPSNSFYKDPPKSTAVLPSSTMPPATFSQGEMSQSDEVVTNTVLSNNQISRNRQGQVPKFRSIKAPFSPLKLSYWDLLRPSFYYSRKHTDSLYGHQGRSMAKKEADTSISLPRNVDPPPTVTPETSTNDQDTDKGASSDSWRHHILFFS
ncbi:hypothetical protein RUM44_012795 [Polyplax serrata]|uniref:Serpin domain-containing protein n=1 Tax=Polyplax serrata TaxID=468196 RepID=A0ABR1BGC0_POLSC